MPQLATIVLTDDHATDHSFSPKGVDAKGVATYRSSTGVPIGDKILSASVSQTANGRYKVLLKLTVPIVQSGTVDGITRPTVVRAAYADVSFSFDGGSSTAERADVRSMISDLLGDGQTFAAAIIEDLEAPF